MQSYARTSPHSENASWYLILVGLALSTTTDVPTFLKNSWHSSATTRLNVRPERTTQRVERPRHRDLFSTSPNLLCRSRLNPEPTNIFAMLPGFSMIVNPNLLK
ncbi:hypothetical protein IQ07DRAFT_150566 [Pyrenochaeta sp. DS3sAY3a]|nr:hypothetical protein IQ07DRAFT_150566 [Pyrenochaeta sp. DS3sAY3a]